MNKGSETCSRSWAAAQTLSLASASSSVNRAQGHFTRLQTHGQRLPALLRLLHTHVEDFSAGSAPAPGPRHPG